MIQMETIHQIYISSELKALIIMCSSQRQRLWQNLKVNPMNSNVFI